MQKHSPLKFQGAGFVGLVNRLRSLIYRNYMNGRRDTYLIFYLSEGAHIREGGTPLSWGAYLKKCKVDTSKHIIFQTTTRRLKNKKGKYDLLNLEIITERVCKFPYYEKPRISDSRKLLFRH